MTGWLLSFVPTWVWVLVALAGAFAVRAYFGEKAALIVGFGLALFAAYQTGVRGERQRGEAQTLRAEKAELLRQRDVALDIQTRMAETMAALRADNQEQKVYTDALVEKFRTEPPPDAKAAPVACRYCLSDADRVRLRGIRIGPPNAPKR